MKTIILKNISGQPGRSYTEPIDVSNQKISSGGYLPCNKNTKKTHVREIIFGSLLWSQKRAQSIQHALFLAPKNTFELVLSAEIDQFEVEEVDFFENPYIFLCPNSRARSPYRWLVDLTKKHVKF